MKNPTLIEYDNHEYLFEGFSILSHYKFEHVSCLCNECIYASAVLF